ncbi:LOB domain-containing protein 1 [Ricinus communis]|uniref:LOB domain-containing protein 1 n=1 Tax=Ricinus communis TaxID=3988 RepID=UPI00201AB655|nr:LOB domain-containing protein 1 [Ricinus communis]
MDSQALARGKAHQPCAACRMLRRRCDNNCVLAPYFPYEIENFAGVHKVFGASNVIKMIQMVEETRREDAVKAIIYEATARLRDPVYGCAGTIFHLQKMVHELNMRVETVRSQVLELQEQRDQLLGILTKVHLSPAAPANHLAFDGSDFSLDGDNYMGYDPVKSPVECDWIV